MAGYIEDRWLTKRPDPKTGKRRRTALYGSNTKRYRVCGIPSVRARSFEKSEDAKAWLRRAAASIERGDFVDPRSGTLTLQEYVEKTWWPMLRMSPTTKGSMKPRIFKHILPHMGHYQLRAIGADEIKGWLSRVEEDIDVSTARVTWRHFSKIMQSATAAKKIAVNPFRDPELKAPTVPKSKAKAWTVERVAAVRSRLARRYRILVDEGVGAGLRQGEAFGLSPDDFDGDVIHVTRQIVKLNGKLAFAPPKGGKERDAPCPPELADAVKAHMEEFPPVSVTLPWIDPDRPNLAWGDRPLVTVRLLVTTPRSDGKHGGALTRDTFNEKQWKPALAEAGVIPPPVISLIQGKGKRPWRKIEWDMPRENGFHALRHTFASVVLAEGETIGQLAEWLGHSDSAFTLRVYVHFMPDSGRKGIAALGRWLRQSASETASVPPQARERTPETASSGSST
ncbi:site-specific integrase [Streptomyces sp. XC 2026]|uniref:site-specific integrase n=1 Tax=Streptomyces sp. XC 2026 TaxID=2782004 RepID=UPI001902D346|nr:site-specific integrase [Streptomyces sp. XC 2026]QQN79782.1 site-specific integrase [Streptomyces sp. XC 2026]QQN80610.1 site-specific integrase [Streptomyces sp. XC 2026]